MKKFEYINRLIFASWIEERPGLWRVDGILETKLNWYGEKGWELVSIKECVKVNNKSMYDCVFKREVQASVVVDGV
jgi:hypothetical protein